MIRRYSIQCFLLALLFFSSCEPVDNTSPAQEDFFVKFYGDSREEQGSDVLVTDTGYLVFGSTNSPKFNQAGGEDIDFCLVFTDFQGNQVGDPIVYGTATDDIPGRIKRTSDGGYIFVGTSTFTTNDITHSNIVVYKLDASGATQWNADYGFEQTNPSNTGGTANPSHEEGYDVVETPEGDFVVLGTTTNVRAKDFPDPAIDTHDLYLFKIRGTSNGATVVWRRTEGFVGKDEGRALIETNTGFALVGNTSVDKDGAGTGTNILFLTTDKQGLDSQFKVFGSGDGTHEVASRVRITSDGGLVIVGTATSGNDVRSILMKVTPNRTLTFFKTMDVKELVTNAGVSSRTGAFINNWGRDVIELSTGGYLIVGKRSGGVLVNDRGSDPSGEDMYLIKTDPFGNLTSGDNDELQEGLFERKFGGLGNDEATSVVELPGGKLVVGGTTDFGGSGFTMMTLMKLNRRGELKK